MDKALSLYGDTAGLSAEDRVQGITKHRYLSLYACPPPHPKPAYPRPSIPGLLGGGGGQRVEEQGTWASQKHSEAGNGRPVDRGAWAAKTVKRPRQQPAQPPIRQLLGAADVQTAHPATFSTAPAHQLLGSANAETTPAGAPAAAADRTQ